MSYRPFSPSIFGPYRQFYEDKLKQLNGTQRSSLGQVREEDSNVSEVNIDKEVEAKRKKTDFTAFHKKQNIKFFKDSSTRRTDRMSLFQEGIKQKRSQILMDKRRCEPMATTQDKSVVSNGNVEPGNSRPGMKESRKEQLLRWKKEKEAALALASKKSNTKPPFKGGQINKPANVQKGPVLDTNSNNNKNRLGNPTPRPGLVSVPKDGIHFVPQAANIIGAPRRVTRAMTKAQSGPNSAIRPPAAPVNKMQSLTISNKNKIQLPNNITKDQKNFDVVSVDVAKIEVESKAAEVIAPLRPPKKLKPKAIDKVYIEFNSTFSEACKELRGHSDEWKNVVEWPDIPEDVREDIICYVGQANLMLDSKLPQFGQLLYSYLCHEMDPGPILPCDLQGWWDVAVIQVDAIKSKFDKLKRMQMNGWVKEVPDKIPAMKTVLATKSENKLPIECRRKPVQASKGIREFLARKRQLTVDTISEEKTDVCKSKTPEKKFEGGFFAINSPVKLLTPKMTTRLSFIKGSPHTPSRRSSSTNVSLRMLSVRKSMGSICKIGVNQNDGAAGENDVNANQ